MDCANPECSCTKDAQVTRGLEQFCGDSCAHSDGRGISCDCGHLGCADVDETALEPGADA